MEHPLTESAWRRGWNDTKTAWKSLPFVILDAVVCVVVGSIFGWYWGLGLFVFAMICAWIGATASAPVRQRNEARQKIKELETRKPELFDIEWPSNPIMLFTAKKEDGQWVSAQGSISLAPIVIINRESLLTITHLSLAPSVRFIRDNGWESTNAIRVKPLPQLSPIINDITVTCPQVGTHL